MSHSWEILQNFLQNYLVLILKKPFQISLLFAFTSILNSFGQSGIQSGNTSKAALQENKLVGTWRLIEFADLDSGTLTWIYPYGKNPMGYFTYTSNGIVNLNICSETPFKISEDIYGQIPYGKITARNRKFAVW